MGGAGAAASEEIRGRVVEPVLIPRLRVTVNPLSASEVNASIANAIAGANGLTIANLNLHGLYVYMKDQGFREYTDRAAVTLIDGMPVLVLASIAARMRLSADLRIGSTDWLFPLLREDPAITILAVGGTPESAREAEARVNDAATNLRWIGFDGFNIAGVSPRSPATLAEAIALSDIVLVGMGMPRQEHWIEQHKILLEKKVVANVGGCIDYLAGNQPLAPRWTGRLGVEWLYRLLRSPRRLGHRYLIEPIALVFCAAIYKPRD